MGSQQSLFDATYRSDSRRSLSRRSLSRSPSRSPSRSDSRSNSPSLTNCNKNNPRDEYIFLELVGTGSTGVIYKVQDKADNIFYAVKVVDLNATNAYTYEKLSLAETSFLAKFSHPHIIQQKDCFIFENVIYSVLDLAVTDLYDYFDSTKKENKPLSELIIYKIFKQLIAALKECHAKNVTHRDIKLENILIKNFIHGVPNIMLADFGLATNFEPGQLIDEYPGSPTYAAPELITGRPYPAGVTDIWAVGIVLYILYYGTNPFWNDDIDEMYRNIHRAPPPFDLLEHRPSSNRDLETFIKGMLTKDFKDRFTINDILNSEWMKRMAREDYTEFKENIGSYTNQELKQYVEACTDEFIVIPRIANDRLKYMIDSLKINKFIKNVTVYNMNLDATQHLIDLIQNNDLITTLNLNLNPRVQIPDVMWSSLLAGLKYNSGLTYLTINDIKNSAVEARLDINKHNKLINSLTLVDILKLL